jgi:streptomycin 6-kinase
MAVRLFDELLSSSSSPVLLHGDLHHMNILKSQNTWKPIDPKGVAGEPSYGICALMLNPISRHSNDGRTPGYAIAQAVLPAWWSFEDSATDWESALACAQTLVSL